MTDWWWWPRRRAPAQRAVLFFPPAGSDQTIARTLVPVAAGVGLGVLRLPGRGPRQAEAPPTDLRALTAAIAAAILALDGPAPLLVGHSFGGLLAYVAGAAVEEAGGRVGRIIAVASASPPAWQREVVSSTPAFAEARTQRILDRGGLPAHIAADADLTRHARGLISTDIRLMQTGFPLRVLRCPVTVIRGRDDRMVHESALDEWSAVTSQPVESVTVPGDHFFYRSAPQQLVSRLRMEVSTLDGAYELQ